MSMLLLLQIDDHDDMLNIRKYTDVTAEMRMRCCCWHIYFSCEFRNKKIKASSHNLKENGIDIGD